MASDTDSPDSSSCPNKRLKTLTNCVPEPAIGHCRSESMENLEPANRMEESDLSCCGVCFSDEGKSIRGQIDSCDHYFCFVCIMEWAKIESRCPLCKGRFTSIRRPPKQGVFSCERIVNVPHRDQVYHCHGNSTSGPFDPYANVRCSVCHGSNDESLLLLCDLCDMAAHTFCVGLGATVPEGDWFCHDCTILKSERSNAELEIEDDQDNSANFASTENGMLANSMSVNGSASITGNENSTPPVETNVSIFDIVSDSSKKWTPRPRVSSLSNQLPQCNAAEVINFSVVRNHQNVASNATESGARTLRHCRDVQGHIQALRENWNALRNGALSFRPNSVGLSEEINKKRKSTERSGQEPSSSSRSSQQSRDAHDASEGILHNNYRSPQDIEKAWKMLEKAKSMRSRCKRGKSANRASKHAPVIGYSSKQASNTSSSIHLGKTQQLVTTGCQRNRMEPQYDYQKLGSQRQIKIIAVESCKVLPTNHKSHPIESPSSRKIHSGCNVHHINGGRNSECGTLSNVAHEESCSFSKALTGSIPGRFDSPRCNMSSSCGVDAHVKNRSGKSCVDGVTGKEGDAKSEIQSLVKLNLKLLSGNKKLGYNAFKEVARFATHTILAACGLEHPKPGVRSFPSSVICSHLEDIQQLHRSTLMPNSCRECFYFFVKDVVNSIMNEKDDHGKLS